MSAKAPLPTAVMRAGIALAALAAAAGLASCAGGPTGPAPLTPDDQYSITVTQSPTDIALAVHARGLSPNQQAALTDFFARWRDNGGGVMTVRAATNAAKPGAGRLTADATMSFLGRLGVPADHLRLAGYVSNAPDAPVLVSFMRYQATGPDCSGGWGNLTSTGSNRPFQHYGCAVTANIAQMIANPRDLVIPAAVDPADNGRREVVMNKYRQGSTTSTSPDSQASGSVSAAQ